VFAVAYAEAGSSAVTSGARRICWALVLSTRDDPIAALSAHTSLHAGPTAWLASLRLARLDVPRLLRLYAGLARGGVAKVGQVQLLQPLLTFVWPDSSSASTSARDRPDGKRRPGIGLVTQRARVAHHVAQARHHGTIASPIRHHVRRRPRER